MATEISWKWKVPISTVYLGEHELMLFSTSKSRLQQCLENFKMYCQKWCLLINTEKTKTMVLSKKYIYISETFTFGDIPWQKFKSIDHLGFVISYNEKYRSITHHRIMKSIKMANIVLQRMWTNMDVSARLALPLFDKQTTIIVLYGCPVWSLPDSQPACMNIKKTCIWRYCWQAWHLPMLAVWAERFQSTNRCILIRLNVYGDKVDFFFMCEQFSLQFWKICC